MVLPINVPALGPEETQAVLKVLKSGMLTSAADSGGPHVRGFERLAAGFVKSKFAVAVNSGTAALQAALHALGVGAGDEVLIPSFTFVATANAVTSIAAKPVFVDISRQNYTMDPSDLEKKITKRSKAVIPVHLYGSVAHMEVISRIARKHGLAVIEDAAQSMGSTYKGRQTGTFSDVGCFSLYPAKVMTAGEGGLIVTNSARIHKRLLTFRNHGMLHGSNNDTFGLNLRMPEISAAIASVQIKKLKKFIARRRHNARIMSELLSETELILPRERKNERTNWYLYTVASERRDRILKRLTSKGFGAAAYYATPIHKMPFYSKTRALPTTEWAASRVLSVPIHPLVTERDLRSMADIIRKDSR